MNTHHTTHEKEGGWGRLHYITKGRKPWECAHCGQAIDKGTPHYRRNHYADASDKYTGAGYRFCESCGDAHEQQHPVSTTFPTTTDARRKPEPDVSEPTPKTDTPDLATQLHAPFSADDLTWKIQTCGENDRGFWALVVPYLKTDAIRNRLDAIVGPANWKTEQFLPGPAGGLQCGLSLRIDGEWITKWDGAENTQIESVKGGMSDAFKRAARCWGIGRYLTQIDTQFADISPHGTFRGKTKSGKPFRWDPPAQGHADSKNDDPPAETSDDLDVIEKKRALKVEIASLKGQRLDNGTSAFAFFMKKMSQLNGNIHEIDAFSSELYRFVSRGELHQTA